MKENLYKIDKENLILIRKFRKLTQADFSNKLGISLRKYVGYETSSEDVFLSSLDFGKLVYELNTRPYMLLGELPETFTSHWRPSGSISAFAKHILSGRCQLEVCGLPSDKDLRAPLVDLAENFERSKAEIESTALSDSLKQQFKCEDLLEELTCGGAQLFGMEVPLLTVDKDVTQDDEGEYQLLEKLIWKTKIVLLLDFDQSAEDQPVTHKMNYGDDEWAYYLDLNKASKPEAYAGMVKQALDARPKIPLSDDDDEYILQTEPVTSPAPTVDEGQLIVTDGAKNEKN